MLQRLQSLKESAKQFVRLVRRPVPVERAAANQRVYDSLPDNLKTPYQALGIQQSGCAATHNIMERCNFSCTACYLSKEANQTPPLPFEEVKEQIDAIYDYLGPGGNLQVTAGEVTLMPVEDLTRIVKYATDRKLSPMVMTHGDTFRQDKTYLDKLILDGGLRKVAIHIDTTQRGRMGVKKPKREAELDWLRDEFADMIRDTRVRTGVNLHAAHTFTIDDKNFDDVPGVMRWMVQNSDAFRLISFQPTADVGRTRTGSVTGNRDKVWDKICEGVGVQLNRHPFLFGHPDCNYMGLFFTVKFNGETHVVEVNRDHKSLDSLFVLRLLHGPLAGYNTDGLTAARDEFASLLGHLKDKPSHLLDIAAYGLYRAFGERKWLPRFIKAVLTGQDWQINPTAIIVHNFMSKDELDTPVGRARLDACAFRLPVNGEMVPMCKMNGTDLRRDLNLKTQKRLGDKKRKAA